MKYFLTLLLNFSVKVFAQNCFRTEPCKCFMEDNSGYINLKSLASSSGGPRWTLDGGDGYFYQYNPCVGFENEKFTDLAVLQVHENNSNLEYNLGIQSTETFVTSLSKGLSITYASSASAAKRKSEVILECIPGSRDHELQFVGELIVTEYEFILKSPCACPGLCDDTGLIVADASTSPQTSTTPPSGDETLQPDPVGSGLNWNQVGSDLVGLIFHDFILVAIIASTIVIVQYIMGYRCHCYKIGQSMKFTDA